VKGKQTVTDKEGKTKENEFVWVWTNLYKRKTRVFSTTIRGTTMRRWATIAT